MKSLLLLLILFSANAFAEADCEKHPIYCHIIKNMTLESGKVCISKQKAMKVSNLIYKMHKKYNISARLFTAMLRQESRYSLKAQGIQCIGYQGKKICGPSDYGISQVNITTAERFGFDLDKLSEDLEYSIEAGAIVLADFKKKYEKKDGEYYWLRYNCGTKKGVDRETCQNYRKKVEKFLK